MLGLKHAGYAIAIVFGLVSLASAQISVESRRAYTLSGIDSLEKIGSVTLVGENSQPKLTEVAIVRVVSPSQFVRVQARRSLFDYVVPKKLTPTDYMLEGEGEYAVEVTTFDPNAGIDGKTIKVVIGKAEPPKPPKPPTPDVPADDFDNIGQRVATWAAGLPSNRQIAAAYRKCHPLLVDSTKTINEVTAVLLAELSAVPSIDRYQDVRAKINADLGRRVGMSRGVLADYYMALAAGFEGAK